MRNRKRKYIILSIVVLILIGISLVGIRSQQSNTSRQSQVMVKDANAQVSINKTLSIPVVDNKGKEVTKILFEVENAELRDEIIFKGKRNRAVKGRQFLVINLRIENSYNRVIELQTKNFLRLSVNGNEKELFASDVNNDPVEVQAISTKHTRLIFPINDSDKNLVLYLGDVKTKKEKIPLKLQ